MMAWLLAILQRQCSHHPINVKADIMEGGLGAGQIQWCEYCGAYRHHNAFKFNSLPWRRPEPTWCKEKP